MRADAAAEFGRRRQLPRVFTQRIEEYFLYQWTYLRGVDESSFFVKLPASIRSEALVA